MMSLSASLFRPLFEFIFPASCCGCGGPLQADERKVCNACWSAMNRVSPRDNLYRDTLDRLGRDGLIDGLVTLFSFEKEGPLQSVIHHLKYSGITGVGIELGMRLGPLVLALPDVGAVAGVVAVPLHRVKLRERGYNQSDFVAKGIAAATGLAATPAIIARRKYTQSQTSLGVEERKENVDGAFDVGNISAVRGETFLLVDDVITTGATMRACAEALRRSGAARLIACSVALAER